MGLFKSSKPKTMSEIRAQRARAAAEDPDYAVKREKSKSKSATKTTTTSSPPTVKANVSPPVVHPEKEARPSLTITDSEGRPGLITEPKEEEKETAGGQQTEPQDVEFADGEPWIGSEFGRERLKRASKIEQPPPAQDTAFDAYINI